MQTEKPLVHFRDEGGGSALLLLHALPVDGRMWSDQAAAFSETFRVLSPDFWGFGLSPAPRDFFSLDDLAGQLVIRLRSLGIPAAAVAGCSMGGYVGLAMLRLFPEFVLGIALVNSRAAADSKAQGKARTATIERVLREGSAFLVDAAPATSLSPASLERMTVLAHLKAMVAAATPAGVIAAHRAIGMRPDSHSVLTRARVPISIVHGADDSIVPLAEARDLAASIPGATFVSIPEAGHLSSIEQPKLVSAALRDFLKRVFPG